MCSVELAKKTSSAHLIPITAQHSEDITRFLRLDNIINKWHSSNYYTQIKYQHNYKRTMPSSSSISRKLVCTIVESSSSTIPPGKHTYQRWSEYMNVSISKVCDDTHTHTHIHTHTHPLPHTSSLWVRTRADRRSNKTEGFPLALHNGIRTDALRSFDWKTCRGIRCK